MNLTQVSLIFGPNEGKFPGKGLKYIDPLHCLSLSLGLVRWVPVEIID